MTSNLLSKLKFFSGMPQLKVIWPKDGPKGRGHRGFRGGLKDILGGKGPDMFIQKKNDTRAISSDEWGNW